MNASDERAEREHLERVKAELGEALGLLETRVKNYAAQAREQAEHIWEHRMWGARGRCTG